MRIKNLIFFGWLTTIIVLFFYSFTQIDLGLTLTRVSFWQPIQKAFQSVGYFHRPVSTGIYLFVWLSLSVWYGLILGAVKKGLFNWSVVWRLTVLTAIILWLAYNAFSYDLFNYIFDSKIVTYYHDSPYLKRALDFPDDPMLGFMHWTHRYFPYGPAWLAVSVPLSFLGFQKLIPTMLLFKGLAAGSYLLACWSIGRLLDARRSGSGLFGLALFAFNPMIVIETLVSAHNDIIMLGLTLFSFWLLKQKKFLPAWGIFLFAGGIKFASLALTPIFIWLTWQLVKKKRVNWSKIWQLVYLLMFLAILAAVKRDELKPWYWLYPLTFLPFVRQAAVLVWPTVSLSLGLLLYYAPFFYRGNWDPPVPQINQGLALAFLVLGLAAYRFRFRLASLSSKLW